MNADKKKFLLLDSSSYLYRAFHAFPPLTNAAHEPVGAIFGFLTMLQRVMKRHQPQYCACIFDPRGPHSRTKLYCDYKRHRQPMPDGLRAQIPMILELVSYLGFSTYQDVEEEADDVIGTLAKTASTAGYEVLIATSDKDLAQLVEENIYLLDPQTGDRLGPEAIREKYGVDPAQIVDFLALKGDASDNIPGVPGIGDKTALALLSAYGSLDQIYASLPQIAGLKVRGAARIQRVLAEQEASARLSQQLALINTAMELRLPIESLRRAPPVLGGLLEFFRYHGFKHFLAEAEVGRLFGEAFMDQPAPPAPVAVDESDPIRSLPAGPSVQWVAEEGHQEFLRTVSRAGRVAIRSVLPPSGAGSWGVLLALPDQIAYFPSEGSALSSLEPEANGSGFSRGLVEILEDKAILKVGHQVKALMLCLRRRANVNLAAYWDVQLAAYVLNTTHPNTLPDLLERYCSLEPLFSIRGGLEVGGELDPDRGVVTPLQAQETRALLALQASLQAALTQQYPAALELFEVVEQPLLAVLADMEQSGVCVDEKCLLMAGDSFSEEIAQLTQDAHLLAGQPFNLNSNLQVQNLLFTQLGLPMVKKTKKGSPSTNEETLRTLAREYPLPGIILRQRALQKLKTTYTDSLVQKLDPSTHRVHTTYQQTVTATGRLSSIHPNLQNIPIRSEEGRKIRTAFQACPGALLLVADYSQIELRIMAHFSKDPGFITAFQCNQDIHTATAAEVFGIALPAVSREQRRRAKAINFGLIYGMSAFGLARQLRVKPEEAQRYITRYFQKYPKVLQFMEAVRQAAAEKGYVETILGRRIYLPLIHSPKHADRQAALRAAINAPMQGTASEIIKCAMLTLAEWIQRSGRGEVRMVMQVHDELVLEVEKHRLEEVRQQVERAMETAIVLTVPLRVDIGVGHCWTEAKA